jgi:anti-sigma regulatory factor (Ser/Thr protein kinase)/CheY-like chemotaxis protein
MPRILLILEHQGNRRLLEAWVRQSHQAVVADAGSALDGPFDLVILDGRALEERWRAVQARKQAEGAVFFPVLLLVPRQQAGMVRRHLGQTVDELLLPPIDQVELQARIEVLLRVRQQSLKLKRHNDELEALLEERRTCMRTEVVRLSQSIQVRGDQDRLIQILTNLLSNAYKYAPEDTTVTIRVQVQAQGEAVQVDVVDRGIGIAEADQAHLFSRFFRTDAARRSGAGGTGLGLSITRSLVELHGGRIWVTSRLGHGSTFSFTLAARDLAV